MNVVRLMGIGTMCLALCLMSCKSEKKKKGKKSAPSTAMDVTVDAETDPRRLEPVHRLLVAWGAEAEEGCYQNIPLEEPWSSTPVSCQDPNARFVVEKGTTRLVPEGSGDNPGEVSWLRLARLQSSPRTEGGAEATDDQRAADAWLDPHEQWSVTFCLSDGQTLGFQMARTDEQGRLIQQVEGSASGISRWMRWEFLDPETGVVVAKGHRRGTQARTDDLDVKVNGLPALVLYREQGPEEDAAGTSLLIHGNEQTIYEWDEQSIPLDVRTAPACVAIFRDLDQQAWLMGRRLQEHLDEDLPVPGYLPPFPLESCCGEAIEGQRDGQGNCLPGAWRELSPGWRWLGMVLPSGPSNVVWTLETSEAGEITLAAQMDPACDQKDVLRLERTLRKGNTGVWLLKKPVLSPALRVCDRELERPAVPTGTLTVPPGVPPDALRWVDGQPKGLASEPRAPVPGQHLVEFVWPDGVAARMVNIGDLGSTTGLAEDGCLTPVVGDRCPIPHDWWFRVWQLDSLRFLQESSGRVAPSEVAEQEVQS